MKEEVMMTDTSAAASIRAIESRMRSGEPFTYGQLCRLPGMHRDDDRLADKAIQRWRRRGWISFERVGRNTLWTLTEVGKVASSASA